MKAWETEPRLVYHRFQCINLQCLSYCQYYVSIVHFWVKYCFMNEFIYCPNLWDVKLTNKCCMYLRCTIRCFDICIHFEMITTIKLVNIPIISYSYLYLFIFRGSTWDLFVAVQSLSHVWLFATPWTAACQAALIFAISQSWLKFMSIELLIPSYHLILCCLLPLLSSNFPSIRVFSNSLYQVTKVL